jgi:flagellar FliL protein
MAKEEEKKEAPTAVDVPSSGGGGKLGAMLAVVNLLLTIGIGSVVFIQFKKDKNKEQVSDIQTHEPAKAEGGEHGGGEHGEAKPAEHGEEKADEHGGHGEGKAKPAETMVSLEQFTVNLSTAVGAPPKFARVVIAVELNSSETSQEFSQKMPQVRNAILDLFNSKRPADLQTGEGRNFLKDEIKNALNSFLVTGKVKGVYFSNFNIGS